MLSGGDGSSSGLQVELKTLESRERGHREVIRKTIHGAAVHWGFPSACLNTLYNTGGHVDSSVENAWS